MKADCAGLYCRAAATPESLNKRLSSFLASMVPIFLSSSSKRHSLSRRSLYVGGKPAMTRADLIRGFIDHLAALYASVLLVMLARVNHSSRVSKNERAGVSPCRKWRRYSRACCSAAGSPYCSSNIFWNSTQVGQVSDWV